MVDERCGITVPPWLHSDMPSTPSPMTHRPKTIPITMEDRAIFIMEIIRVCKHHNLWLAHEDDYGAFRVQRETTEKWLEGAITDE